MHSGFYSSRIRYPEMIELFEAAGFMVQVLDKDCLEHMLISRSALDDDFRHMPIESLQVSGFDVVLMPQH